MNDRLPVRPNTFAENAVMATPTLPFPIRSATDPVDPELEVLMREPLASAWSGGRSPPSVSPAVRRRLLERAAASREASRPMVTMRLDAALRREPAPGVCERLLYEAPRDRCLRPGEPWRSRILELASGVAWRLEAAPVHRAWLVLQGIARIGTQSLSIRDYHLVPAGAEGDVAVASDHGARLFLREWLPAPADGLTSVTVRDAQAEWPEYAPGIRRRVLWSRDGVAAMLYNARAGVMVPHHTHGHDEECLMVQGELFLDDQLLREGDYQLAPAGTGHRVTETDTGAVIYAHGDLDLRFVD
ncbi:MAG: hypothetical protein Fur0019_19090 [Tibeticola sp.]